MCLAVCCDCGFPTLGLRTGQHRQSGTLSAHLHNPTCRRSASTTCQFPVGLVFGTVWANGVLCPPSLHRPAYGCRRVRSTRPTSPFLDSEPIRVSPAVCTQPAANWLEKLQKSCRRAASRMQSALQASHPTLRELRPPATGVGSQSQTDELKGNKTGRKRRRQKEETKDQTVARGREETARRTHNLEKELLRASKKT